MIIQDALPGIKRFLKPALRSPYVLGFLIRLRAACCSHTGRLSASPAAGAVRTAARHRAAVARFRADCRWSQDWKLLQQLADLLLQHERRRAGWWIGIVDQTYCGQQGQQTENTFRRGNYRPRTNRKPRRHKKRSAKRSGPCFVRGLLLTPGGLRLPLCRCYYTREHGAQHAKTYRRQGQRAAALLRALVVPAGAEVLVLGDTAFDAQDVRQACQERGFSWIVPVNPERVLAGKKPRPKVVSVAQGLAVDPFACVRLTPGQGDFVAQRRVARCRIGPKAKPRTFYVHQERRAVHSVGAVRLFFSTKEKPLVGKRVHVQKILMTNRLDLPAAVVVELYELRWQSERFFKELKSTLGFHQYRFREFQKVEGWAEVCLATFVYLEWYRAQQLRHRDLSAKEKRWWQWQRSHGLCLAVRQATEERELGQLAQWCQTPTGRKKLRRVLRAALPLEYRTAG